MQNSGAQIADKGVRLLLCTFSSAHSCVKRRQILGRIHSATQRTSGCRLEVPIFTDTELLKLIREQEYGPPVLHRICSFHRLLPDQFEQRLSESSDLPEFLDRQVQNDDRPAKPTHFRYECSLRRKKVACRSSHKNIQHTRRSRDDAASCLVRHEREFTDQKPCRIFEVLLLAFGQIPLFGGHN